MEGWFPDDGQGHLLLQAAPATKEQGWIAFVPIDPLMQIAPIST
jgi:hypothetical protein